MLKKLVGGLFLAALATCGVVAWRGGLANADNKPTADRQPPDEIPVGNQANLRPAHKLPVTQVVLFNSGVGYFHRSGEVEGEARVDLQFSAADINDLIKSLVVHDAARADRPPAVRQPGAHREDAQELRHRPEQPTRPTGRSSTRCAGRRSS